MKKGAFSKRIASVLFAVMAILAVVGGTFAIYTSQVYQRAVVRNRYNDVIRFSSDKLLQVPWEDLEAEAPEVYYPVPTGQKTLTFQVYNYDQSKSTLISESEIGYTITFSLADEDRDFEYLVNGQPLASLQNSHHVLPARIASADSYTVTFSEKDYLNLKLTVTVTPDKPATTRNKGLKAVLIPIEYGTTQQFSVKREFPDSLREDQDGNPLTPQAMDAYNVLVTATGGQGDVHIRWNHTMVEIDRFFLMEKGVSITKTENLSEIVLSMNSADETASYLIPFYNVNPTKPQWTDWAALAECITVATE